jgi:hypothetical protein
MFEYTFPFQQSGRLAGIFRDNSIDVMCLTESWHDSTSVATARLRAQGYNVADRPRPRIRDDMSTNHGGIVVFSSAFAQLSILPLDSPSTFETLCVRVTSGRRSEIVVVIYRPGSQAISSRFFDDVTALLDHVATFAAPVFVCGDFNVRFDRPDDQHAVRLCSLLTCHGLPLRSTGPTHVGGGTLDAVAANAVYDINATVTDVGISDHAAICWSGATANRPSPTYASPAFVHGASWILICSVRQFLRRGFAGPNYGLLILMNCLNSTTLS